MKEVLKLKLAWDLLNLKPPEGLLLDLLQG